MFAIVKWITVVYHQTMSREDPQMKIRLPADLKDQIETASKNSGRSMNAEIVARLQDSFNPLPNIFINDGNGMTALVSSKSKLTQLAGDLNSLQDQRNTLAVLLHAAKSSGRSQDEIIKITGEMDVIDKDIANVLSAMQHYTSRTASNH